MGAREAEWQPPSKANAWPIVLELENHPKEDYLITRLYSAGSDVMQQCGFARAIATDAFLYFYLGVGESGQYLALDRAFVEFWFNDSTTTTSTTAHPTSDPTWDPTRDPTFVPSTQPSSEPTMGPTSEPSSEPTIEP